jgi:DNA polymerase III delta subunit
MEFRQLKQNLDNGIKQNFYIFTGEEKEVMRKYIRRIDPNYKEAESFQSVITKLQSLGLFNQHNTYVIHNDKSILERDIDSLLNIIGPNRIILIYDAVDMRNSFFKKAEKDYLVDFKKFTSEQLIPTVQRLVDVTDEQAYKIAQYCNNEVSRIELECDKLKHLGVKITDAHIEELLIPDPEDVIFDMIEAAVRKNTKLTFMLYEDLKERKEAPVKIVSVMYNTFRNVLLVQGMMSRTVDQIASQTGLNPYVVKKYKQFKIDDPEKLIYHLIRIQEAETDIKTGRLEAELALDTLLLDILK